MTFPEIRAKESAEHTDLTEMFKEMLAAVDETTEHYKTDLAHDLAILMHEPRGVFLWMVYESGTQIVPLDNLELMDAVLRNYANYDRARWFHIDLIDNKVTELTSVSPWEQYYRDATYTRRR